VTCFTIGIHKNAFINTLNALSLQLLGRGLRPEAELNASPPDLPAGALPPALPLGPSPRPPLPLLSTNSCIRHWLAPEAEDVRRPATSRRGLCPLHPRWDPAPDLHSPFLALTPASATDSEPLHWELLATPLAVMPIDKNGAVILLRHRGTGCDHAPFSWHVDVSDSPSNVERPKHLHADIDFTTFRWHKKPGHGSVTVCQENNSISQGSVATHSKYV